MDDMESPWCETTDKSWGLCESTCGIEGKYFIVNSISPMLSVSVFHIISESMN